MSWPLFNSAHKMHHARASYFENILLKSCLPEIWIWVSGMTNSEGGRFFTSLPSQAFSLFTFIDCRDWKGQQRTSDFIGWCALKDNIVTFVRYATPLCSGRWKNEIVRTRNYFFWTALDWKDHWLIVKESQNSSEIFFHFCLSAIGLDVPTGHIARVPSLILPFQYGPTPPSYTFPAWLFFYSCYQFN